LSGDKRAVPILLDTAKNGYVVVGGVKASDLRANAAIDLARIAGKETYDAFKALAAKEKDAQGIFGEALDRMQVAKDCDKDLDCFAKVLNTDESWTRAEKAAFAIGFSGNASKGVPILLNALKPVASLPQLRYPCTRRSCSRSPSWPIPHARCARRSCSNKSSATNRRSVCPARATFWARPAWPWRSSKTRRRRIRPAGFALAIREPLVLRRLILRNHGGANATTDVEVTLDAGTPRMNRRHQVVQDAVDDGLVKGTLVAVRPQVQLPRLELDAKLVGHVLDANRGEIGLTGLGTKQVNSGVSQRIR